MTRRMCGDSSGAREDFEVAIELLKELTTAGIDGGGVGLHTDKYNTEDAAILGIRLSSLRALCFIDTGLYNAGHDILINTNVRFSVCVCVCLFLFSCTLVHSLTYLLTHSLTHSLTITITLLKGTRERFNRLPPQRKNNH